MSGNVSKLVKTINSWRWELTKEGNISEMVGLAPKWVRLDPKLDKSGTFSDQISVHLARGAKCTEM